MFVDFTMIDLKPTMQYEGSALVLCMQAQKIPYWVK